MPTIGKSSSKIAKSKRSKSYINEVLADYRVGWESRHVSLTGRKEVLTGKAKFGIFGDGKEVAQLAMAKAFENGDFRSGYYRDQTFMLAIKQVTIEQLFAQLYADPSIENDPHSAGRQMNAHFATQSIDENGEWKDLTQMKNTSADVSCTAAQMARVVGLALASKKYREIKAFSKRNKFSNKGNEVAFATIGDASTSEGLFWEAINAAGVMQVPLAVSIWDDGYGISVPTKYQTTKENIYEALQGFGMNEAGQGYYMRQCKGWDYPGLCDMYQESIPLVRKTHNPVIFHISEITQPQGHSTSGSHERYKSKERLEWERNHDCLFMMKKWIIEEKIASEIELDEIEAQAKKKVNEARVKAWKKVTAPAKQDIEYVFDLYATIAKETGKTERMNTARKELEAMINPFRREIAANVQHTLIKLRKLPETEAIRQLKKWRKEYHSLNQETYSKHHHNETASSALNVPEVKPVFDSESRKINGYQVLNKFFDLAFERDDRLVAFGEDVGHIGDVNQGFAGLQAKHGKERIFDTGIREATIIGQGLGMAMRGLRPIAEIQYIDYFIYGMQPLVDDLSCLQYRTYGRQRAPLIVRTRGHRLEGIWHTGSPMGMILNGVRGIHFLVPRDMTRAAGFYNTLLQSEDPAIVVECLNGYRLKERLPENLADFTVPIGIPETLKTGTDLTFVTYGSCVRVVMEAVELLEEMDISCEVIDVQSLLPFDINHDIVKSLASTNRLVIVDEDVPGGASAFILREILEIQQGYRHLDSQPITITAKEHRSAYGSDGDYYCKPNAEQIMRSVYELMHEVDPSKYPLFY